MFSKTCEYAMRAMIFIAQNSIDDTKVGVKVIAAGIASPEHFIAKILQDLSRKKMVQSLKGPNGGFYLDSHAIKATLADIVRTIDGNGFFIGCGLGLKQCSELSPCPLHDQFAEIRKNTLIMLEGARLDEVAQNMISTPLFLKR